MSRAGPIWRVGQSGTTKPGLFFSSSLPSPPLPVFTARTSERRRILRTRKQSISRTDESAADLRDLMAKCVDGAAAAKDAEGHRTLRNRTYGRRDLVLPQNVTYSRFPFLVFEDVKERLRFIPLGSDIRTVSLSHTQGRV